MNRSPFSILLGVVLGSVPAVTARWGSAADLNDLATVVHRTSHRASSFDPTGGNTDCVADFEPGKSRLLLDIDGPGTITHCWFTASSFPNHSTMLRDLVLRIYWENSPVPSVDVPLGDFFGLGHGKQYQVHAAPINVGANPTALNCYWPMPFHKHVRIELVNTGPRSVRSVYYNINYELGPVASNQGLFHAVFRSVKELPPQKLEGNTTGRENYVILDARGEGHYVGCFLFVDSAPGGWWGEGDEMMFIDGEKTPSIIGTGTEDYFCNAWGFNAVSNFPFYGVPLLEKQPDGWTQTSVYRLHIPDPVRFKKGLRVTIEHGWRGKAANDYSSVAYWYQLQPAAWREPLPAGPDNQPRAHFPESPSQAESLKISATELEPILCRRGIAARAIRTGAPAALGGGFLRIDAPGKIIEMPIFVPAPGKYRVAARLYGDGFPAPVALGLKGGSMQTIKRVKAKRSAVELGVAEVGEDGLFTITMQSAAAFAVDYLTADPIRP